MSIIAIFNPYFNLETEVSKTQYIVFLYKILHNILTKLTICATMIVLEHMLML